MTRRLGVYPGSFNPPTIGHLAIARAALHQRGLDRVDLMVSRVALGKELVDRPAFDDRIAVLEASVADIDGLEVAVTDHQLLADIARGYDVVVMGADKWAQVLDPAFYGHSEQSRDQAVDALSQLELAIAPRPPFEVPSGAELFVDAELGPVSSSGARQGRPDWMTAAARAFDEATGAWSDPDLSGRP
ncbi:nicotinate-nicotinamide nucleotide adenylyltransferase [Candidatus Poriferisocius sp.]|uniref:nicotinate-nicotinamide nucleotide adenylyltransferase n=1 Tax=Candidatus Poriferisocius sp. TaxID=3101276 RepID=UPI003B02DACE